MTRTTVPFSVNQALVSRWFAMMDDRRQREVMRYVADIAVAFPRTTKPDLQLRDPDPVIALTTKEQRWLEAYRMMDDEGRHKNLIAMESQASRFPRWVKPRLRPDGGGAV